MKGELPKDKITKLNRLVETLCGIYSRVARRLGVDRSFVSRVARGERRSEEIENALAAEYERAITIETATRNAPKSAFPKGPSFPNQPHRQRQKTKS